MMPLTPPNTPNKHSFPLFFVKPIKPHFEPCVFHDLLLLLHLSHRFVNPYCNFAPCWHAGCAFVDSFGNQPLDPHLLDMGLEGFIKPKINGLTEGSTSARNVLHFNTKLLNLVDN